MLCSLLAVFAGFMLVTALTTSMELILQAAFLQTAAPYAHSQLRDMHDAPVLSLTLADTFVFSALGSYAAARHAPQDPQRHALALGVLWLLMMLVSTITRWHTTPAWYHFGVIAAILPAAWLGGHLRERQLSPA